MWYPAPFETHFMRRSGLGFGILLVALADVNLTSYLDMGISPVMVGKNSPGTGGIYFFRRCRLQMYIMGTGAVSTSFSRCDPGTKKTHIQKLSLLTSAFVPHVTGLVHNTYSNYSNQLVPSLLVILHALW